MGSNNSIVVTAPVGRVWGLLRNFHDFDWAPNVVTKLETEGKPDRVGARRILNDACHETLLTLDDATRSLRYDGPGPVPKENVEDYVGEIRACPVTSDDATFALWTSGWQSGGKGAADFCSPIYQAVLADLQLHFS